MTSESSTTRWAPMVRADSAGEVREAALSPYGVGPAGGLAGSKRWSPAVACRETREAYELTLDVPGFSRRDLEITLQDNTLQVQGARPGRKVAGTGSGATAPETFRRALTFPGPVDPAKVEASLAYGILRVELPKSHPASPPLKISLVSDDPEDRSPLTTVHLKDLHDPRTGRLDAGRIAAYLDIPLKKLAEALDKKYTSVHKTPAAPSLQPGLQRIKRILEILEDVLGDRGSVLAWWHSRHPDLGDRTPLDLLLEGHAGAIADMLEAALTGTPS